MKNIKTGILYLTLITILMCVNSCANKQSDVQNPLVDTETAFSYLKQLEGKWIVQGGKEGIFRWEFDLTSRDGIIIERLKKGTPTEMLTVYNLDDGILRANHFCQLQNQPNLTAVTSETEGDLHFLCNGLVGNTKSHGELHMHGVHFQKTDSSMFIWMDMYKDGKIDFETRYELFRVDSEKGRELTNIE
jgi:hypothetical protein